jgi:hypothetical protein
MGRTILWWGRFDPNYSRNRIVRQLMRESGAALLEFAPRSSLTAALEAWLHRPGPADLVWVPAFRLRDLPAALAWGRRMGVQVVFDPMISAWDKQVFERRKFAATSSIRSGSHCSILAPKRSCFGQYRLEATVGHWCCSSSAAISICRLPR